MENEFISQTKRRHLFEHSVGVLLLILLKWSQLWSCFISETSKRLAESGFRREDQRWNSFQFTLFFAFSGGGAVCSGAFEHWIRDRLELNFTKNSLYLCTYSFHSFPHQMLLQTHSPSMHWPLWWRRTRRSSSLGKRRFLQIFIPRWKLTTNLCWLHHSPPFAWAACTLSLWRVFEPLCGPEL